MASSLLARVRDWMVEPASVSAPLPLPTHALVPLPKPTAVDHALGAARWPFLLMCAVSQWKRTMTANTVDIDLADPRTTGRMWGGMNQPIVQLHLPYDMGRMVHPDDTLAVLAMPADDPRTAATLAQVARIWDER